MNKLEPKTVLGYIKQINNGLTYLHERRIYLGYLRLEYIYVCKDVIKLDLIKCKYGLYTKIEEGVTKICESHPLIGNKIIIVFK